jgi:hypothetical protein
MDCKKCAENLTAYRDKELSTVEFDKVQAHLRTCAACAEELQSLGKAAEYVESQIRELSPRPEMWRFVQARISAEPVRRSSFFGSLFMPWRIAAATLAVIAALGLGYTEYQQIQKKNLEKFVSTYLRQRETQVRARAVVMKHAENSNVDNPFADNPFIEVNATPANNPFGTEDQ